jgi:hypothetical protein
MRALRDEKMVQNWVEYKAGMSHLQQQVTPSPARTTPARPGSLPPEVPRSFCACITWPTLARGAARCTSWRT